MSGVDADLASVRDSLTGGHSGRISQGLRALARVEAELARLREQRDALDRERDAGWRTMVEQRERAEAAETRCAELAEQGRIAAKRYGEEVERCARLQQALERIGYGQWEEMTDGEIATRMEEIATEALAGPDTPADSRTVLDFDKREVREEPFSTEGTVATVGSTPPADSPEPREGIVMVYDWQHRYLGCMGVERWQEVLAADSPLCPCGHSADHHPAVWSMAGDATTACQMDGCGCDDYDGPPVPADSQEGKT